MYGVADEDQAAPTLNDRDLRRGKTRRSRPVVTNSCSSWPRPWRSPRPTSGRRTGASARRSGSWTGRPSWGCGTEPTTSGAHLLAQLGDRRGADGEIRRAKLLEPTSAVDFFQLGHERVTRGDLPPALRDFDRALQLQPDHFWAQYFSAVCYLRLRRPSEAKACLTAYLSRRPDFIWIYLFAVSPMASWVSSRPPTPISARRWSSPRTSTPGMASTSIAVRSGSGRGSSTRPSPTSGTPSRCCRTNTRPTRSSPRPISVNRNLPRRSNSSTKPSDWSPPWAALPHPGPAGSRAS